MHAEEAARDKSAKNVFECIRRIQRGSPEIEKIINLFVRRRFGGEEDDPPLKTNLDLMTLKFLYRNDLQPSVPHALSRNTSQPSSSASPRKMPSSANARSIMP